MALRTDSINPMRSLWFLFALFTAVNCSETVHESPEIPLVSFTGSVFVDSSQIFNNESLYYPAQIRVTPDNEIVIMD
ncbi:hypothetical protein IID62_10810, partial [candidate division KSB1 bacterium]|nr:hypothetical protein [candidate division KSB1 bacterium]